MEKVWLKYYPQGVPAEINPNAYSSLIEIFEESCKTFADHPAFNNLGTTLTFQQINCYAHAFAAYLQQELKLKKGDRLAIMLPNLLQYPIVLFGALRAGLTVVNVNPLYTVPEFTHQIKDSGAETVVVLANFANTVQDALTKTALKQVIVTHLGDLLSPPKSWLINFYLKYIIRKIPRINIPNQLFFNEIIKKGKQLNFQPVMIQPKDIAFLQYTGGTTGVAKGAMLTHRNMVANILQADAWLKHVFQPGKEIIITALPLYHIFSLLANCLVVMKVGGLNVLITNPRQLSTMIKVMGQFKFTVITGVNTLFNKLLSSPQFKNLDFSALKLSLGGGAAVQEKIANQWQEVTGNVLLEAYGLTETSPCVSVNPPTLKKYNGTAGLPVSSTDVCIMGNNGHKLSFNQAGELAVKGPQVMLGYWNNPDETRQVFTHDEWLLTGDIASINEQGFIKIIDRKKEMIIVSGFNVYPNELEDALVKIPGVIEAAVIGVPDDETGEAIKAFVVKNDPALTVENIIQQAHTLLAGYKIPKYIEFRKNLPKSNIGKVLRRELKDSVSILSHQLSRSDMS
jgi:long-chain acyl-CoA synthetase